MGATCVLPSVASLTGRAVYIWVPIRVKKRSKLEIPDDFKNQVEYVNEAYIGSQFDTLQTFAMKKTNISEKDHKE